MEVENILKGKIAKFLIKKLLETGRNRVYSLGKENLISLLEEKEKFFDEDSEEGRKISAMPDFVVFTKKGKMFFVEVKYRTDPEALEETLLFDKEILEKFWQAKIILLTLKEKPYFRVISPPYFRREKKEGWPIPYIAWKPLSEDKDFNLKKKTIERYEKIAQKYYGSEI